MIGIDYVYQFVVASHNYPTENWDGGGFVAAERPRAAPCLFLVIMVNNCPSIPFMGQDGFLGSNPV